MVISRSGRTSEALRAAQVLEREKGIRCLGVTCTAHQPLEQIASRTITLLTANEQSTVMTRSFTSMLLALQYTAACFAHDNDNELVTQLKRMAGHAERVLSASHPEIRKFVDAHQFADYIALGQGPYYGLACECGLKLSEMSIAVMRAPRPAC